MELVYFDLKHAKETHDTIISISGGIQGVIDLVTLQARVDGNRPFENSAKRVTLVKTFFK